MRKKREPVKQTAEEKGQDYCERLAELERELSAHLVRPVGTPSSALPSLRGVESTQIGEEAVVQFTHGGHVFAAGHTDASFAGTNGARGIRRIHFYDATGKIVLGIAGEFENQQIGANFRSPQLKTYHPGSWETPFLAVTTGLRTFRADRKENLRLSRIRANRRRS